MKKIIIFLWLTGILFPTFVSAQNNPVKQVELTQFHLQSSYLITEPGSILSSDTYHPKDYWFPVKVPSTVLTGLVANHIYPDPYIGMNNMLIPDASDSFNVEWGLSKYSFLPNEQNPWKKPYWYRTTFNVPSKDKGRFFQLIFKGINYRAAVWLNGRQMADSAQMAGMFAEYALDVSKAVKPGSENILAVEIYPLDYPGLPAHPQLNALGPFYENGGPTGDIGKNVTMLCSVGWDWIPAVRDRNMGIWQPVYLRTSGWVTIDHPKIVTQLPDLPDTNLAKISLQMKLTNHSGENKSGKLLIRISPENFTGTSFSFEKMISLPAGESKGIDLDANQIKQLIIRHPHLWWPNGYGNPNLYRISLQYVHDRQIADDTSFVFGIRTVSSEATEVNGWTRRDFYVNGRKIHLDGGAWVPDMMLNRDSARYDDEIRLCRNAHINLLRIWGGGVTPPDVFFELADRYGMLVWQDFWVTGDTQGEFKGSPDWPLQSNVFIRNMTSTIYRIRNHPGLLLWTGGNEGHARKELYNAMRDSIIKLDGTRPFMPSSSGYAKLPVGWKESWPDNKPAGVYSGGPYSWQDPSVYYQKVNEGKDWVFKDETGIPSQPPYSSLHKIIPDLIPDATLPYPLNNTWGYHDACTGNGHYELYYDTMVARYGEPAGMKDFSEKMQFMNANGYRGIFEAAASKLNQTGGVMLWKLNAAFPSVIWQIYDWYLEPNAGYYFIQRALAPVHIQLNLDDSSVAIINRSYHPENNLSAQISVCSLNNQLLYQHNYIVSISDTMVKNIVSIAPVLKDQKDIVFILLSLKDKSGKVISHNTYWMQPAHNYKELGSMPKTNVDVRLLQASQDKSQDKWTFRFTNSSNQLVFFVHPRLMKADLSDEILPACWSDNYFSLAPHETITVTVSCPKTQILKKPKLLVGGWNIKNEKIINL
ncbi:MAG: hypothetical protein EPN39_06455 [Chitinophagaceae bacterium]|nr:MAG: hypothetical protein EPN39_06455 [Chitinophagaceae bacterium]